MEDVEAVDLRSDNRPMQRKGQFQLASVASEKELMQACGGGFSNKRNTTSKQTIGN